MPSRLFPYAFLLSLSFISVFTSQDLRYYQDLIPVPSTAEVVLKRYVRFLKAHHQDAGYRPLQIPELEELDFIKDQRRGISRVDKLKESQEFRDALSKKAEIGEVLSKQNFRLSNYPLPQELEKEVILQEYPERSPGSDIFRYLNPSGRIRDYQLDNGAELFTESKPWQNLEYENTQGRHSFRKDVRERGMKEEPQIDYGGRYLSHNHQNSDKHSSKGLSSSDREENDQGFTFSFPEPNLRETKSPFAVGPNDPRFYQDGPFSTQARTDVEDDERTERILQANDEDISPSLKELKKIPKVYMQKPVDVDNDDYGGEENLVGLYSGLQRRAENHGPLVTSVNHRISNDIYFIAVVAGCSAAAMFVLVLISLTWCRFQRGAKAAADVEYPAYGVTGPNKDTSPSGDRRLAQSAQMYHYQHQKQQIIAMESRTATARDPGSVSEAESDEENEEGDYTVYECPGLAPTGEMEVKNPLFHDDPTPATPAGPGQRSAEDHM